MASASGVDELTNAARRIADSVPDPARAVATAVALAAGRTRGEVPLVLDGRAVAPAPAGERPELPTGILERWGPWLPGVVRELVLSRGRRRRGGVHHTSPEVARAVVEVVAATSDVLSRPGPVVGDPAVGGGAFLLAVLDHVAATRRPHVALRHRLVSGIEAVDVDPLAVAATRAALGLWVGAPVDPPGLVVGDHLEVGFRRPVDLIVGNPPFRSPQRRDTARGARERERLARRWPEVGGLVDDAMVFWRAGLDALTGGGVMALVQPLSSLGAQAAAAIRVLTLQRCRLAAVWVPGRRVFDAAVDVCVPVVIRRGATPGGPGSGAADGIGHRVVRHDGLPPRPGPTLRLDSREATWSALLPAAGELVTVPPVVGPRVADVADVVAGHRDHFYGLRGAVRDEPGGRPRLVTSGLIDPFVCRWGRRPARFDRRIWTAPVVEVEAVAQPVRDWMRRRLRPKVLVASQTRVVEAAADVEGIAVPGTPVVSVEPRDRLLGVWMLVAAVGSPASAARTVAAAAGTGLSAGAVRVSRRTVAAGAAPTDTVAWRRAADLARQAAEAEGDGAAVMEAGRAALIAEGLDPDGELFAWWCERLPRREPGL